MKTFKEFIEEVGGYYHSAWRGMHPLSSQPSHIPDERAENSKAEKRPIWLSHDIDQAKGWSVHTQGLSSKSKNYHVAVKGDVAHHNDENIQNLFKKHRISMDEYHHTLFNQPTAERVHKHPATRLLKRKGYVGYSHPERNPHRPKDWSWRRTSTVIFHRKHAKFTPIDL